MSRYSGPNRDRSPPRFSDRRPSFTYNSSQPHQQFRSAPESAQGNAREIPRGPKADTLRGTGPPPARSRGGFNSRADFRDRDNQASFRREAERPDWARRDRDFAFGDRESSQSRDSRAFQSRERSLSPSRTPRDVKDAPPSSGPPQWHGAGGRGTPNRGRGRGDWERGRGRGYPAERDGIGARSRSREEWRERDRGWDHPESESRDRFSRRDPDRSRETDDRDRDAATWRPDRSPTRNVSANQTPSSSRIAPSVTGSTSQHAPAGEQIRRYSSNFGTAGPGRDKIWDEDSSIPLKTPLADSNARRIISPPPAPPVPAFGSPLLPDFVKPVKIEQATTFPQTAGHEKSPVIAHQGKWVEKSPGPHNDAPFQPPTGPKADRAGVPGSQAFKEQKRFNQDIRSKSDSQARPIRPSIGSNPTTPSAPPIGSMRHGSQEPFVGSGLNVKIFPNKQLTLKPAVQSSSSLISINRPDHISNKGIPRTPTAIPTGPAAMEGSPTTPRSAIPTGPRMQGKPYPPWNSSSYKVPTAPARPSIMNSAPSKPSQMIHRERNYNLSASQRNNVDPFPGQSIKARPADDVGAKDPGVGLPRPGSSTSTTAEIAAHGLGEELRLEDPGFLTMPLDQSSDEEGDDDGLDEEDFADSERRHKKEIELLSARKPPPLLRDPVIVNLLIRIQLLSMIVDGAVPSGLDASEAMDGMEVDKEALPVGLPSPKTEDEVEAVPPLIGRYLKEPPYNPIPTPPLEDLPFLSRLSNVEQRTFDISDGEEESYAAMETLLCSEFASYARDEYEEDMDSKSEYCNTYRPWRAAVAAMDRNFRENNPLTPVPASPPLSVVLTAAVTPLIEKTRGAKNITELDFQNVLKASEESAREEQERRDRELMAKSNPETEASVPAMLHHTEMEDDFFEDKNQLISVDHCLDLFAFVPPQDDFTPEEQKKFIMAFNNSPKKWSQIAGHLPGRDFQQCILHYYLTKHTARYKEIYKKTLPKKRRGRGPAVRPRPTALMSDMVYEKEEMDGTPLAVTDSGRPRRAAAPTFGEALTEADATVVSAPTSRRGTKEPNGDPGSDKPTGRKRAAPKGPRRPKATLVAATGQSPLKASKETKAGRGNGKADVANPKNGDAQSATLPRDAPSIELDQKRGSNVPATAVLDSQVLTHRVSSSGRHAAQSNSYWSVPETNHFPVLVDFFGRDWAGIAKFMGSKTPAMVKNHFVREAANTKHQLEDRARAAEERKQRGESPGFVLEPIPPPKRKYETAPASQRSAAASGEPGERKTDSSAGKTKGSVPGLVDDFTPPFPQAQTIVNRDGATAPAATHAANIRPLSAAQMPSRNQEGTTTTAARARRPSQGPKPGFFNDGPQLLSQPTIQPTMQPPTSNLPPEATRIALSPHDQPFRPQNISTKAAQAPQMAQSQNAPLASPVAQPIYAPPQHAGQLNQSQHSHVRGGSVTIPISPVPMMLKQEPETGYRRTDAQDVRVPFGPSPAHSPTTARFPHSQSFVPVTEPVRPHSTPVQPMADSQRIVAPKRSNLMSLLNDDQPEPSPRKRPVAELERTSSLQSSNMPKYSREPQQRQSQSSISQREDLGGREQVQSPYHSMSNPARAQHATMNVPEAHQSLPAQRVSGFAADGKSSVPVGDLGWRQRFDPRQGNNASSPDQPARNAQAFHAPQSFSKGSVGQHQPLVSGSPYQNRLNIQHPLRAASPVTPSSGPPQQLYHPPETPSSQGGHSRISSRNQLQHSGHSQSGPVPVPLPTVNRQVSSVARPPSNGYDSRSIVIEPHRQPAEQGYSYQVHQQQQQQQQPQTQAQQAHKQAQPQQQQQHRPQEWQDDLRGQFRPLSQHPGQPQPQPQPQQHRPHHEHIHQQQHVQQQSPHQLDPRGGRGDRQYFPPQPQTPTYPAPGYGTHPSQHQQPQQHLPGQQSHSRHYSQSNGGPDGTR